MRHDPDFTLVPACRPLADYPPHVQMHAAQRRQRYQRRSAVTDAAKAPSKPTISNAAALTIVIWSWRSA
jgi:hypothetical protein